VEVCFFVTETAAEKHSRITNLQTPRFTFLMEDKTTQVPRPSLQTFDHPSDILA